MLSVAKHLLRPSAAFDWRRPFASLHPAKFAGQVVKG